MHRRLLISCCPCWHTTQPRGPRPQTAYDTRGSPRRRHPVVVPGTTALPPTPETRPSSLRVPIPRPQTSVGPRRHHPRPLRRPEKAAPARLCVVVCSNRGGLAALWGRSAVDGGGGGRGHINSSSSVCAAGLSKRGVGVAGQGAGDSELRVSLCKAASAAAYLEPFV